MESNHNIDDSQDGRTNMVKIQNQNSQQQMMMVDRSSFNQQQHQAGNQNNQNMSSRQKFMSQINPSQQEISAQKQLWVLQKRGLLQQNYGESIEDEGSCYTNCLDSLGGFISTLSQVCPCCNCTDQAPVQQIDQGYGAIIERFGKFKSWEKPGVYIMNSLSESITKIDIRKQILDLPKQRCITSDNIECFIDASINYKIHDPKKARYTLTDFDTAIKYTAIAAIRAVCGIQTFQQIVEGKELLNQQLAQIMIENTGDWGIEITNTFIKDTTVDGTMKEALSKATAEKRIAQSKIIQAQADIKSAQMIKDAADSLDTKAAMQIRYLDTLGKICTSTNTKIIMIPKQFRK